MILTGKELIRRTKSSAAKARYARRPKPVPGVHSSVWVKFVAAARKLRRHYEKKGVAFNHTDRSVGTALRFVVEPGMVFVGTAICGPSRCRGMIRLDGEDVKAREAVASLTDRVGFYVSYCKRNKP